MIIIATQENKRFLISDNPGILTSSGKIVDIETKECFDFENIQLPLKFGYWEEILSIDPILYKNILEICNE